MCEPVTFWALLLAPLLALPAPYGVTAVPGAGAVMATVQALGYMLGERVPYLINVIAHIHDRVVLETFRAFVITLLVLPTSWLY